MSFTIRHSRNGAPVGEPDNANTMFAARTLARRRQEELRSHLAVIVGTTMKGEEKEIETIEFLH
jgi:hypothetical protein